MSLLAQTSSDNFVSILNAPIGDMDSIGLGFTLNFILGAGDLIDSFFEGMAKGSQQYLELKDKIMQMADRANKAFGGDGIDSASTSAEMANQKTYTPSAFYKKYDGSSATLKIDPTFLVLTTDDRNTAVGKLNYAMQYLSPSRADGSTNIIYRESPPNKYYFKRGSFDPAQSLSGTFGLRIGNSQIKYMVPENVSVTLSTQQAYLSDGSTTPLWGKLNVTLSPANRLTAAEGYNMLKGSSTAEKN